MALPCDLMVEASTTQVHATAELDLKVSLLRNLLKKILGHHEFDYSKVEAFLDQEQCVSISIPIVN
jgi:hypothetical protein